MLSGIWGEDLGFLLGESAEIMNGDFSVKGKGVWNSIPQEAQNKLLRSVWCTHCHKMTTITNFSGTVDRGDLILKGNCATCGNAVARLIEGG